MFRRKRRKEENAKEAHEVDLLELADTRTGTGESTDVYMRTAILLAHCPNTFGGLVVVIGHLLAADAITREQLATIGLNEPELEALNHAFEVNSNVDDLVEDLAVSAARRAYDADLGAICKELGLGQGTGEGQQFRSNLAGFALNNGIEDINIAYRLMRLERPDLLPQRQTDERP
jgi:hypothetical protein